MGRSRKATKAVEAAAEDTAITEETVTEPMVAPEAPPAEQKPDIFDEQIARRQQEAAQAIVQGVADATKLPEQEPASHAERVGKRGPRYNEQGINDKLAGANLLEHHDPYLSIIRFEEKPSDAVRQKLREAQFRWEPQNEEWSRPIRFESRAQDRLNAERVFDEVCKMIREEKGITHSFGGAA